jgi:DNA sulfur modification protein DndB
MTFSTLVTATHHMFPNLKSKKDLEPRIDWAATFWATTASILPNDPWRAKSKEERSVQRQELLAVSAVVFQALGIPLFNVLKAGVKVVNGSTISFVAKIL